MHETIEISIDVVQPEAFATTVDLFSSSMFYSDSKSVWALKERSKENAPVFC